MTHRALVDPDSRIDHLELEVLRKTASLAQEAIDTARTGGSVDVLLSQLDILEWLQERVDRAKGPWPGGGRDRFPPKGALGTLDLERLLARLEFAIAEKGIVILREKRQDDLDRGWLQALSWFFFLVLEVMELDPDPSAEG